MSLTMHQASVGVLIKSLENLSGILGISIAHASAHNLDHAVLLEARLAPDMFPLVRQVQIAADHAKAAVAKLSGVQAPKFLDDERSFEQLQTRIANTVKYISSVGPEMPEQFDTRMISIKFGGVERQLDGRRYLLSWVLPNFFFHVTTAYDILRHGGVPLGKRDFLGEI
ncbi:hypothetical protein ACVINW_001408 [Bradyrhizobium sp. USDA 4461]